MGVGSDLGEPRLERVWLRDHRVHPPNSRNHLKNSINLGLNCAHPGKISRVNFSGSNLGEPRLEGVWLRDYRVHPRVFRPPDPAGDFDRRPGPGLMVQGLGGRVGGLGLRVCG